MISTTKNVVILLALITIPQVLMSKTTYNRWVSCIAEAIYQEARGEPKQGRIAVGRVVINRVLDDRYPNNPCDVVFEPAQFSWSKTWKKPQWDTRSYNDAVESLKGSPNFNATHFHSGPKPYWAYKLKHVTTIGNHHFYK